MFFYTKISWIHIYFQFPDVQCNGGWTINNCYGNLFDIGLYIEQSHHSNKRENDITFSYVFFTWCMHPLPGSQPLDWGFTYAALPQMLLLTSLFGLIYFTYIIFKRRFSLPEMSQIVFLLQLRDPPPCSENPHTQMNTFTCTIIWTHTCKYD